MMKAMQDMPLKIKGQQLKYSKMLIVGKPHQITAYIDIKGKDTRMKISNIRYVVVASTTRDQLRSANQKERR